MPDRPLRVAVVFDTAGFVRSLPLTGAAARTLHLNAHLAAAADVTLLLCDLNPASQPTGAWPFPVTYLSPEAVYRDTTRLAAQVARHGPDVVVISSTNLVVRHGRAVADAASCALVYEMLDDEAALQRSLGASPEDAREAGQLQRWAIALADGVVTLTDADAAAACRVASGPVHVVPCGAELPTALRPAAGDAPVFVGNVHYEPNLRAVHYLRHTLAPALHRAGHRSPVHVIGRYPPVARPLTDAGLVRLHGPVPDLASALGRAAVGLAPLDAGGGMKLKVLHYMAAGLPVVGTPTAFTGFDQPDDFALVAADDLGDFPDLVARLLADPELRLTLGRRGRDLAASRFSWPVAARLAAHAYGDIAGRTRETVSHAAAPPEVAELAARPPYWLHEWRRRHEDRQSMTAAAPAGGDGDDGLPEDLAAGVACARVGAEAALDLAFTGRPLVGYGNRSAVIVDDHAVLKVYTHRGSERMRRERTGLEAAADVAGLHVPAVLGHAAPPGGLPWLALSRLAGTIAASLPPDPAIDAQVGRLAAHLHTIDPARLTALPSFERHDRSPDTDRPAVAALAAGLAAVPPDVTACCRRTFVHGDYSRRNVVVDDGIANGLIDFERCGTGCPYDDLATFQLHDVLLGVSDSDAMLAAYTDELTRQGHPATVDPGHLTWHVARYAAWILQWAFDVDPPLAGQVSDLVSRLVGALPRRPSTPFDHP